MKCPKCNTSLLMSEKTGIEIDYCPDCRGIWLDRGELDKIIERSSSAEFNSEERYRSDRDSYLRHRDDHDDHHDSHSYKYGRRRNFFSELFD